MKFFDIEDDFKNDIEYYIKSKIYDSIDEDKGEYKGSNLDLYYYLTGKTSLKESPEIIEDLYDGYYAKLESIVRDGYITSKEDVEEAEEVFKNIKKNQSYFTEEQLNKLNALVKKVKEAQKKDLKEARKNDKKRKKKIIILIGAAIIVILSLVLYFVLGEEQSAEIIGPILGVILLAFLYIKFRKARKKAKDFFKI